MDADRAAGRKHHPRHRTAAARTATAASPPTRPSASRPTCSSQQGGTGILGETPEIYGAEHLLTRRAVRREVGEKLVERIKWWEWYTGIFGAEINNNPSPGNKEGGLTTIYEKSLGAIAKARQHGAGRRGPLRRAGDGEGLRRHGHAGLRPGEHDRHRRRRGERAASSRPAAAACSAASRPRRSRWRPTRRCTST